MSAASPAGAAPSPLKRMEAKARRMWRRHRALSTIRRAGLFDQAWYLSAYPDVAASGVSPIDHYLTTGAFEGRNPTRLFDSAWYLEQNADVAAGGQNPLLHYCMVGDAEGRDPNPYFSVRWYRGQNPDIVRHATSLTHFIRVGARKHRDPSPLLDVAWYVETNPDLIATGLDPLSHFLTIGLKERRKPRMFNDLGDDGYRGEPVHAARMAAFKQLEPVAGETVALMVCHAPGGRLKPNVKPYVAGLRQAGLKVVLIAAVDAPLKVEPDVFSLLSGGYVRENKGYDFAAWAHLLRSEPTLFAAEGVLLVNDSLIGPLDQAGLERLIARARVSKAAIVGATESLEFNWHLQSFFLLLKPPVLASFVFHHVLGQIRNLDDKEHVIRAYELTFAAKMQPHHACEGLFRSVDRKNRSVVGWRDLVREGFPFVKTSALSQPEEQDSDWRAFIASTGFDPVIAEKTVAVVANPPPPAEGEDWPLLAPSEARVVHDPPKVAFVGPWNYASGLGSASRGYVSAWQRVDARLNLFPIEKPFHIHAHVAPTVTLREFEDEADVAVVHLNPDGWTLLTEAQRTMIARAKKTVGIFVWEMDRAPDSWLDVIRRVDAIWAPSQYCADVFGAATTPVTVVPHVTVVPPPTDGRRRAAALQTFGFPADAKLILYAFDGASYLVRKNPHALVRAFAASGLAARGWRLVLKTKHLMDRPADGAALAALVKAARGAQIIDQPLAQDDMAGLFEAADIYASPHRSEGFGLTIAEAMALGKTVVATDYSGSRDFLDSSTGYPVPYTLKALDKTHGHYTKGGLWADVSEAGLTEALCAAAARLDAGDRSLGEAARTRIAETLSADAVAEKMREGLGAVLEARRA